MTSIKIKFRPSSATGKEGTIFYQLTHDSKVRNLQAGYRIFRNEWDARRSMPLPGDASTRTAHLHLLNRNIRCDIVRLNRMIRRLDEAGLPYSTDDLVAEYLRYTARYSIFNFMEILIDSLKQHDRIRTAETYRATLNSFRRYRKDQDLVLDTLTPDILEDYEACLRKRGNTPNTTSFYMRILRAVYNRAVEEEAMENQNPFRHVYTGVDKTVKRAVPLDIVKRIKDLDLSDSPKEDFARDMFMMSFYLRGMSLIDMAFLRQTDLHNRRVIYRRRKTGQLLEIEWRDEMQRILDKYPENPTGYLLPIIRKPDINQRRAYRNAGSLINSQLKKVASRAEASTALTLYYARHSWASAAKNMGIPVGVISEAMGHDSESTTRIYLASLDSSIVDKANSIILSSL